MWMRGRAQHSLAAYSRYVLGLEPAEHHRLICQAIDDLLNDEYDELIILAPPGSAKSFYTSHGLAAYYMGHSPDKNIILATHTADLSERWSRRVRNTLGDELHQKVFPASSLSKDSTAVGRWATSAGGEFLAAGVGAAVLGFRADLAVIDDPVASFEQAQSQTQLAKIHNWYETDLVTRMKPGGKTVLICQRLARNDLAGYLIDRNAENPTKRQRVLKLRMEATDNAPHDDPLGRSPGERLWPEWFSPEMVADAKRDDFKWRTLYQQEPPADEGSWVSTEDIRFRPTPDKIEVCYGMSDLALSVNTGDYTVHFILAVDDEGNWDIIDAMRGRVDPDRSANDIVTMTQSYKPREWLIDDDNASKVFGPLVASCGRARGVAVPWKVMPIRGQDKETRAAALRGQYKRGKVFMPANAHFTQWLTRELLQFPNAMGMGVDDGVDALSLMGRRMLSLAKPAPTVLRPHPTTHNMTLDQLFEDRTMSRFHRRI
jgi:predicted phage terminase large subunit-like protein